MGRFSTRTIATVLSASAIAACEIVGTGTIVESRYTPATTATATYSATGDTLYTEHEIARCTIVIEAKPYGRFPQTFYTDSTINQDAERICKDNRVGSFVPFTVPRELRKAYKGAQTQMSGKPKIS